MANRNHSDENDPTIFSRGALKLTFELIRPINPTVALTVRNILATTPLPKSVDDLDNEHSDRFKVILASFEVRQVVEALMSYQQPAVETNALPPDPGKRAIAQSLMDDWLRLAQAMIKALPDDQSPFK